MELTITKIGDSHGVILPADILDRMRLGDGDTVYVTELADGVKISSRDGDFDEAMAHAERVMNEDDVALRKLAE